MNEEIIIKRQKINQINDFEILKDDWISLQEGPEMTVFQSFEWNELLYDEWKNQRVNRLTSSIYVYFAAINEIPIMIAPILIQKVSTKTGFFGRNRGIYFLGHDSYSDYLNFVYKNFCFEAVKELLKQISTDFRWLKIQLNRIPQWTKSCQTLESFHYNILSEDISVAVKIEDSLDAYNKKLSKHTKQNLRTAANRMKKGGIDYQISVYNDIHDKELLESLKDIHIRRTKEKNINDSDFLHTVASKIRIYMRVKKEENNNIIYQSMQKMKSSQLIVVRFDNTIVGYLYGLRDGQIIRIMQNCYDSTFGFYSPLFRGAYDFICSFYESNNPIKYVDFTRGDEEYKYKLGGEETKLMTFIVNEKSLAEATILQNGGTEAMDTSNSYYGPEINGGGYRERLSKCISLATYLDGRFAA